MIILDRCAFVKGLLESKMIKQEFLRLARQFPVAAAMKSNEDMQVALESDALLLFLLKGDAFQLAPFVLEAHQRGKGVVVHVDLVSGIGKDRAGIQYLHQIGIDAIITSRSQLVSAGRAEGLTALVRAEQSGDLAPLMRRRRPALDLGTEAQSEAPPRPPERNARLLGIVKAGMRESRAVEPAGWSFPPLVSPQPTARPPLLPWVGGPTELDANGE